MPQLYIPEIGAEITLSEDWFFHILPEYRNVKFAAKLGYQRQAYFGSKYPTVFVGPSLEKSVDNCMNEARAAGDVYTRSAILDAFYEIHKAELVDKIPVIIPEGTTIIVDRIYVRKGKSDYSSVTFRVKDGEFKKQRFWVKLDECNTIHFN